MNGSKFGVKVVQYLVQIDNQAITLMYLQQHGVSCELVPGMTMAAQFRWTAGLACLFQVEMTAEAVDVKGIGAVAWHA